MRGLASTALVTCTNMQLSPAPNLQGCFLHFDPRAERDAGAGAVPRLLEAHAAGPPAPAVRRWAWVPSLPGVLHALRLLSIPLEAYLLC